MSFAVSFTGKNYKYLFNLYKTHRNAKFTKSCSFLYISTALPTHLSTSLIPCHFGSFVVFLVKVNILYQSIQCHDTNVMNVSCSVQGTPVMRHSRNKALTPPVFSYQYTYQPKHNVCLYFNIKRSFNRMFPHNVTFPMVTTEAAPGNCTLRPMV